MKKVRFISLALVFAMLVTLLSGCDAVKLEEFFIETSNFEEMQTTTITNTTSVDTTTSNTTTTTTITAPATTTTTTTTTTTSTTTTTTTTTTTEPTTTTIETPTMLETTILVNESQIVETTEIVAPVTSTTTTTSTTITTTIQDLQYVMANAQLYVLPKAIQSSVDTQKKKYSGMNIGVGIFSLDGTKGYVYNADKRISSACTIKAAYAMFVLKSCESQGIDIATTKLEYKKGMRNDGSGNIKDAPYGSKYTISYLLEVLLSISDNTAYNILVSKFPLVDFQSFLQGIGGQDLKNQYNGTIQQYGSSTVKQRWHEWLAIYAYVNSNCKYASTLKKYLTNTKYCYITMWMKQKHNYMHKSGWSDGISYSSASDCAIIDGKYLVVILSEDYKAGTSHADSVKQIGLDIERFVSGIGGTDNLF